MSAVDVPASLGQMTAGFAGQVPGVRQAVVVAPDGTVLASAPDGRGVDHLPAVACGLLGLARAAADHLGARGVSQVVIEMDGAFLVVASLGGGACLAVSASQECNIGLVGYEVAVFVGRAVRVLAHAPAARDAFGSARGADALAVPAPVGG